MPHVGHSFLTQSVAGPLAQSVAGPSAQSATSPPLTQGIVGLNASMPSLSGSTPLTLSVGGLTPTQSFGMSSQASSIDVPSAPPSTPTTIGGSSQDIPTTPTPGLYQLYVCQYYIY
jgi:hypothetical protein